ncbi:protein kinase [bacterium]|nr:protein kinase [candidate division CSSED10-310 bacterium]
MESERYPKLPDKYQILKSLGHGNMGQVYLAEDKGSERLVAIKVVYGNIAMEQDKTRRFEREFRYMLQLSHENIVRVFDYGRTQGRPFMVMEYIDGPTIAEYLTFHGTPLCEVLDTRPARQLLLDCCLQLARALEYIHERRIVHRDLKSGNVMVNAQQIVKLMDFGVARDVSSPSSLTGEMIIGSPAYLSPEQVQGLQLDARSDLYSLGVMLYKLTTGRLPFTETSLVEMLLAHVHKTPPPARSTNPRVPEDVNWLIMKLLEKEPSDRLSSAGDLIAIVERMAELNDESATRLPGKRKKNKDQEQPGWVTGRHRQLFTGEGGFRDVLLAGEQGIGKTTTLQSLARIAQEQGYDIIYITCVGRSLEPFDLLSSLVANLLRLAQQNLPALFQRYLKTYGSLLTNFLPMEQMVESPTIKTGVLRTPAGTSRVFFFRFLLDFIKNYAHARSLVLCVDDLHSIDDDSLDFFKQLLNESKRFGHTIQNMLLPPRFLLFLAYRNDTEQRPELLETIEGFSHIRACLEMNLERLDRSAIREVTAGILGSDDIDEEFIELLARESEGVPLYITDMIHHFRDRGHLEYQAGGWRFAVKPSEASMPTTIHDVLSERFKKLEEEHRKLLEYASVIGAGFDFAMLEELLGFEESTILDISGDLLRMGILVEHLESNEYALDFQHNKFREYFYEELSSARRRWLHRKIAVILEQRILAGKTRSYGFAASHFEQGKQYAKAMLHLIKAGQQALQRLSYKNAGTLFKHALDMLEKIEPDSRMEYGEQRFTILQNLGNAMLNSGFLTDASTYLETACSLFKDIGGIDNLSRASTLFNLGDTYYKLGEKDRAVPLMRAALELLPEHAGESLRISITQSLGRLHTEFGNFARAAEYFDETVDLSARLGDHASRIKALTGRSYLHYYQNRMDLAEKDMRDAYMLSREIDEPLTLVNSTNNLALILTKLGHNEQALPLFEEALRLYEEHGMHLARSSALHNTAITLHHMGQLERARDYLLEAIRIAESLKFMHGLANQLYSLALIHEDMQYYHEAIETLERAEKICMVQNLISVKLRIMRRAARLLFSLGAMTRAAEKCDTLLTDLKVDVDPILVHNIFMIAAHIRFELGDLRQGWEYLEKAALPDSCSGAESFIQFREISINFYRATTSDDKNAIATMVKLLDKMRNGDCYTYDYIHATCLVGKAQLHFGLYNIALVTLSDLLLSLEEMDPLNRLELHSLLGAVHEALDEPQAAAGCYREARKIIHHIRSNLKDSSLEEAFLAKPNVKLVRDYLARISG